MRLRRALVVLSALAFAACDSAGPEEELFDPADLTRDPTLLIGTWDLQRVTFFDRLSGRQVSHPPSESERLVFGADGTFERYHAGSLVQEGTFSVEEACNPETGHCWNDLSFEGGGNPFWVGVNEEWLVFDARPVDGSENVYRRGPE